KTPGGRSFQDPSRCGAGDGAYPPLRASAAPGRWHGVTALPPRSPVTPTCGAGTLRLGPPTAGCTSGTPHLHSIGHRTPPRTCDAAAPLGWDGMAKVVIGKYGNIMNIILKSPSRAMFPTGLALPKSRRWAQKDHAAPSRRPARVSKIPNTTWRGAGPIGWRPTRQVRQVRSVRASAQAHFSQGEFPTWLRDPKSRSPEKPNPRTP